MRWAADAFFTIGKTHAVCQDFAIADSGYPVAIVSDGCSGSPHTDVGARLLAFAAQSVNSLGASLQVLPIRSARMAASMVGLPVECLDATLLLASWHDFPDLHHDDQGNASDLSGVRVGVWGDGVIAARRRDGGFVVHVIDHPESAPRYLRYHLDRDHLEAYHRRYGTTVRQTTYTGTVARSFIDVMRSETQVPHDLREFFPAALYDLVILMSDGAASFQRPVVTDTSRSLEAVPLLEVVSQLFDIKGFQGEFMQRRCKRFLAKMAAEKGWQHSDDFSAAAIWMEAP